jgi:hypothetical protein
MTEDKNGYVNPHEERLRRVREAYDTMLADGLRPTQDRIRKWLVARYGKAVSLRELVPMLRAMNREAAGEKAVLKTARAYMRLNWVEKKAFMDLIRDAEFSPSTLRLLGFEPLESPLNSSWDIQAEMRRARDSK